jgi:hypothetical protein
MALVNYGGKLMPACLFDGSIDSPPGSCGRCGGSGVVRETIDEERHDEMVPCYTCQAYCKPCGKYRRKGHECRGRIEIEAI